MTLKQSVTIIAIALAFFAGWSWNGSRYSVKIEAMRVAQEAANAQFESEARLKEQEYARQLHEAQHAAKEREESLRRSISNVTAANKRLRVQLEDNERKLSSLSEDAIRQYTEELGRVFAECTDRYASMGEEAERRNEDLRRMIEAWPK